MKQTEEEKRKKARLRYDQKRKLELEARAVKAAAQAVKDAERRKYEAENPLYDQPEPKYGYSFMTPTRIKDELGWTDALIEKYLGEADTTTVNPIYKKAAPMRLDCPLRIAAAEHQDGFKTDLEKTKRRQNGAMEAVLTRSSNMLEKMQTAQLTIVTGKPKDEIYNLALSTHGGNYQGEAGDFRWSDRTAINCIRHNLTNYEELWQLCNRGDTGREAYECLRERVDELIQETYPEYFKQDMSVESAA
jgi:hypothetical protein